MEAEAGRGGRDGGGLRITYVPETFPVVSETFVLTEVLALSERGHRVTVAPRFAGREEAWADDRFRRAREAATVDVSPAGVSMGGVLRALRRAGQRPLPRRRPWRWGRRVAEARHVAELAARLSRHDADVMVCHFGFDNAIAAALAAERMGAPFVQWLHGTDIYTTPHRNLRWLTDRSAAVVTNSGYSLGLMRSLGVRQRVMVSPLGVDLRDFHTDEAAPKHERPAVLCVGRLGHNKNQRRLMRVFKRVLEELPGQLPGAGAGAELWLVGDGPERDSLKAYAEALGIGGSVVFRGRLLHDELLDAMRRAWVMALLSDKEGLGVAFIEAMACGLPCVGPRVGGVPEVIDDGRTGYLVDVAAEDGEAAAAGRLIELLSDAGLRQRMGRAGAERARSRFDENMHFDRLERLLRYVAGDAVEPPALAIASDDPSAPRPARPAPLAEHSTGHACPRKFRKSRKSRK